MRAHIALLTLVLSAALGGCARKPEAASNTIAPTLSGDPNHPGQTKGWVDTKLYFGLGPADRPGVGISEAEWHDFLDKEVTPRFPSGLSVADVYGQWLAKDRTAPERLRSKMLIIDYPDTKENRDKIEAVRLAWKQRTGDKSVLRVTGPVDVSF
jgi:Protein of unknown function (DUF3574)